MLRLGMSDVLDSAAWRRQNSLTKKRAEKLLALIVDLESFHRLASSAKGSLSAISWQPKIAEGRLPRYQVALGDEMRFVYSDEELVD